MEQSKLAWDLLSRSFGTYRGRGVNHEGQNFTGDFVLACALPEKVASVSSTATGDRGEVYHDERSWVGFDIAGQLVLYVASNNHPGITPHLFHGVEEKSGQKDIVFRFGDPKDQNSFREEITFSFFADGGVAHQYAWGLPGGSFEPRSGSKMSRLR